jgi:hypothetical protein
MELAETDPADLPPLSEPVVPAEPAVAQPVEPARSCSGPILIRVLVQASHRLATVALLALLATVGLMFAGKDFYGSLAAACGCADAGLCAALLTLSFVRRDRPVWRESVGVLTFNATLAVVTLLMMLVARLDVIHADIQQGGGNARAAVQDFFTPPPALPPQ